MAIIPFSIKLVILLFLLKKGYFLFIDKKDEKNVQGKILTYVMVCNGVQDWYVLQCTQRRDSLVFIYSMPVPVLLHRQSGLPLERPDATAVAQKSDLPADDVHRVVRVEEQPPGLVDSLLPEVLSDRYTLLPPKALTKGLVGHVHYMSERPCGVDVSERRFF